MTDILKTDEMELNILRKKYVDLFTFLVIHTCVSRVTLTNSIFTITPVLYFSKYDKSLLYA